MLAFLEVFRRISCVHSLHWASSTPPARAVPSDIWGGVPNSVWRLTEVCVVLLSPSRKPRGLMSLPLAFTSVAATNPVVLTALLDSATRQVRSRQLYKPKPCQYEYAVMVEWWMAGENRRQYVQTSALWNSLQILLLLLLFQRFVSLLFTSQPLSMINFTFRGLTATNIEAFPAFRRAF